MAYTPPPGATQNEYGFWQLPNGDFAPGQTTPGARDNPESQIHYDAARDLDYTLRNGKKVYQSPVSYDMTKANPTTQYRTSKSGPNITDTGGGLVHGAPHWNQDTGKWDVGLDWGKVLSIAAAGGIAAPYIIPALAGGGSATASVTPSAFEALPGATTILPTASAVAGVTPSAFAALPSTTAVPAAVTPSAFAALPSTTAIPSTGGNVGWIDTAKKVYDGYSKAKDVYDTGRSIYGDVAATATDASAARAQARIKEAEIQQAQDRLALQRSQQEATNANSANRFGMDNAQLDLQRRQFGLNAPGQRAGNAVRGDILSRAQDVSIGGLGPNVHVPTISGGLRPSMFSGATRELGTNMTNQALAGQQAGDQFDPLTYQAPPPVPGLTGLPQAGAIDSILNTTGLVSTGLDAFSQYLARYRNKPQVDPSQFSGPTQQGDPSLNA